MESARTQLRFFLSFGLLFCLLTAIAITKTVTADEAGTVANTISHSPKVDTTSYSIASAAQEYISPEFTTQFQFNGLGLIWAGTENANVDFSLKVDDGEWVAVEMMGADAKDKAENFVSVPLFTVGTRVQYKISGDIEHVQNVRITYFDSTTGPTSSPLQSLTSRSTAGDELNIISRENWGADESYRFWNPRYITPEKIVIHHTAGGDGGSDPAATVRGIYYWHAVVLGWGDIGYNYIIDQQGNVYEGRYGGSNSPPGQWVAGAHAYNAIDDIDYNAHSLGISILGCFENDEDCSTIHEFTPTIKSALTELIAVKANEFNIKPKGSSTLYGNTIKNIIGHQDVDYTACPGNLVYDEFKTIRNKVKKRYQALRDNIAQQSFHGTMTNSTFATIYEAGDAPNVAISYTNKGERSWQTSDVVMQVVVVGKQRRQKVHIQTAVNSGDVITIPFTWENLPHKPGTYTVTTKLYRKGKRIKGSTAKYSIAVTNSYAVQTISTNMPLAIQQGWIPQIKWKITNTGEAELPSSTAIMVDNEQIGTIDKAIPAGVTKTVSFTLSPAAQWPVGHQNIILYLQVGTTRVVNSRSSQKIRID